uniref:Pre-mRNA splicing Prp18-interacting factor n=1 Tax=Tanacetum cinerariifolium TaxID=118510 RepID=A0A699GYQ0_TANCI|nr:hypothetical protein [Tanacetum cinerariifolium]
MPSFDPTCYSGDRNSFTYDSKSNLVDDSPNDFNPPPQTPTYSYEFCGNDAYYGLDCPLQVPFSYDPEPCWSCGALYTTDYCCSKGSLRDWIICDLNKTPDLSQRPPQNYPKCGNSVDGQYYQGCALLRKKFKEDLFKYFIKNGILQDFQDASEPSNDNTNVVIALQEPFIVKQDPGENSSQSPPYNNHHCCYDCSEALEDIFCRQCTCELYGKVYINTPSWNCHTVCYNDDDDDEDCTIAITPQEPDNSLSMGDEHLDTISATKSDEFIKSSIENLVSKPSESEGEHEHSKENLFKPFFDEEIISMKIDPHHFNGEFDLIESLLNHDSMIISSSSKNDSLFDKFSGELTLLKSNPPGINETDYDHEEETSLVKRLLYDSSSPRPLEEFIFENYDAAIESFSPSPIPIEDSDSFMEEIDLSFTPDDPTPPGIKEDDYDSEKDFSSLKKCLAIIPFHFLKISHFILIFLHPIVLLLNYRMGHEASQPSIEGPMMIYEKNTSILGVSFLHFYPP